MEDRKYQLLCTFATKNNFLGTARLIRQSFNLPYNKIFLYENEKNPTEVVYTYNIAGCPTQSFLKGTILVHRNKESNTIYTINALNFLIKEINNGILDKNYKISWCNYSNMLLLNDKDELKKILIKLKDVLDFNRENEYDLGS